MSELLPCPFCGDEAEVMFRTHTESTNGICCSSEDCKVRPYVWEHSEAEAIEAWNTRAERACEYDAPMTEYVCEFDPSTREYRIRDAVVRCRDCDFFKDEGEFGQFCTYLEFGKKEIVDGFCAWGERREP